MDEAAVPPHMTYRKLFRWLMVAGTAILVISWWAAWRQHMQLGISPGDGRHHWVLNLYLSTLAFDTYSVGPTDMRMYSRAYPLAKEQIPGRIEQHGRYGKFRKEFVSTPVSAGGTLDIVRQEIPIWAPWLVFVTASYAFCRLMEKRKVT